MYVLMSTFNHLLANRNLVMLFTDILVCTDVLSIYFVK